MAKKLSKNSEAILEMADGQYRDGLMDKAEYDKITVRVLGPKALLNAKPISAAQIRSIRQRTKLSQSQFARPLHLSAGYVSQLECGTKEPKGPALALLNVIKRKGFEAIL